MNQLAGGEEWNEVFKLTFIIQTYNPKYFKPANRETSHFIASRQKMTKSKYISKQNSKQNILNSCQYVGRKNDLCAKNFRKCINSTRLEDQQVVGKNRCIAKVIWIIRNIPEVCTFLFNKIRV